MRPFKILFFAVLSVAFFLGHFYQTGKTTHYNMFPPGTHAFRLATLERYIQILDTSPDAARRVIAGPSYARGLHSAAKCINIATAGLSPAETVELIRRHCDKNDIIIYPVSLYTFIHMHDDERPQITNQYLRRLEIGRCFMKQTLTQFSPSLSNKLAADIIRQQQMARIRHIDWSAVDMSPFLEISRDYPNLVFMLYPRAHGNRHYRRADRRFRQIFLQSDLPCLNLTSLLDDMQFRDFFHPASSEAGVRLRRHIRNYVCVR
jgi:hypothetical protein